MRPETAVLSVVSGFISVVASLIINTSMITAKYFFRSKSTKIMNFRKDCFVQYFLAVQAVLFS